MNDRTLGARPPSDVHRHLRRRPGWRTPMRQNTHTVKSDCNCVMVHRVVIPFPHDRSGTVRESRRRSPYSGACAGVARAHRGPPPTMPALPKPHRRERAKARSGLVGLHTVHPGHRGRDPPARDRTDAHPSMPGVPDRHRAPASGRPDLCRRLQKRALAALAPTPPGTLT